MVNKLKSYLFIRRNNMKGIGQNFNDFLKEQDIYDEVNELAAKKTKIYKEENMMCRGCDCCCPIPSEMFTNCSCLSKAKVVDTDLQNTTLIKNAECESQDNISSFTFEIEE